jgi:superfamily I DNA and/or RNA helicase
LPVSKPLATTASSKWVTEQLGAVADARLINVALTRARRALCIIGNVDTLEGSSVGRQLTQYYKDTGCFVSADHWPPR